MGGCVGGVFITGLGLGEGGSDMVWSVGDGWMG